MCLVRHLDKEQAGGPPEELKCVRTLLNWEEWQYFKNLLWKKKSGIVWSEFIALENSHILLLSDESS